MKIEMVEVCEYHELADDAKEKVLSRERELQSYDTWWIDDLKMIFEDMLDEKGIKAYPTDDLEIAMSLSYCQGDGVGFFGKIDVEEFFKEHPELILEYFQETFQLIQTYNTIQSDYHYDIYDAINIESSGYSPDTMSMHVNIESSEDMHSIAQEMNDHNGEGVYYDGYLEVEREQFEEYLQLYFNDIAVELERIGYADMEARESENNIVENLDGNDIRFLKNGYMIDWAIVSEDDLKHTLGD